MAEQAEIPEADSPFGKRVAVTIAIIAVIMAVISNRGDDAKTEALLKTSEAANKWAYFQAKSIKEHSYDIQGQVLAIELPGAVDAAKRDALVKRFAGEVERYKGEKKDIQAEALALGKEAKQALAINDRCDKATLFMQLAVVACSVAILAHIAVFWWGGIAVALVGIALGVSSFWVTPEAEPAEHKAEATKTEHKVEASKAEHQSGESKTEAPKPEHQVEAPKPEPTH